MNQTKRHACLVATWGAAAVSLALLIASGASKPPASLAAPPGARPGGDGQDAGGAAHPYDMAEPRPAPPLKKLTPEQISRIRYLELRGMRLSNTSIPDRVSVKLSRDTIEEFLTSMEGHPDFQGERSRRAFLKKTAPQKLHYIARYRGEDFADKVSITSDPEIFVVFRRDVMPTVLRGCATSACHAPTNENAIGFRLFKDPKKSAATTYANFIILNDLIVDGRRMIDRGHPEESLLLTYMLPRTEVRVALRHPGDVDYKPVFRSRKPRRFRKILKWIGSLKHPAGDYGVNLIPRPDAEAGDDDEPPIAEPPDADRPPGN